MTSGVDRGAVLRLVVPVLVVAGLGVLWKVAPVERVMGELWPVVERWAALPAAPVLAVLGFVLAGLVAVPLSALVVATATVFGPLKGGLAAFVGALASAAALFGVGRGLGRSAVRSLLRGRAAEVAESIADRGVVAVAVARNLPVAPYSMVNLVAGASPIRFRDFMLGTALGLVPGVVALVLLGDRARSWMRDPSAANLGWLAAMVLVLVLLSTAVGLATSRRRRDGSDG